MFPAAILAGGLATRLYPVTKDVPKALLDVGGRPFVDRQLELLKRKGISDVVICLGYKGEQISDHVGDGGRFGLSVKYSFDGDKLLGTGGALRKALPLLGDVFWVMYGDSYLDTDFKAIYDHYNSEGNSKSGLMTVFRNENAWDRSNIIYTQGKIVKYDKENTCPEMKYIDYGLAILRKDAFEGIREGEHIDLVDIYIKLIAGDNMAAYEVKERFYEIGSQKGLEETRERLAGYDKE